MKNFKKFSTLFVSSLLGLTLLTGCGPSIEVQPSGGGSASNNGGGSASTDTNTETSGGELTYAEGTVLRMATGYNSTKTGLSFDAETAGNGITLPDGNTYNTGDLKPTWQEVEKVLGIKIDDTYQGNGAS